MYIVYDPPHTISNSHFDFTFYKTANIDKYDSRAVTTFGLMLY